MAAEPYWKASTEGGQVKLGYVVPDFSPNEYVVFYMYCEDGSVTGHIDLGTQAFAQQGPADAEVIVDGRSYRLSGQSHYSEMDDYNWLKVEIARDAPLLRQLGSAHAIRIKSESNAVDLPATGLAEQTKRFLAACPAS